MCINKNEELLPYYEKAKLTLDYDPSSGLFTHIKSKGNRKRGSLAGFDNGGGYTMIKSTINGNTRRLIAHRLAWFICHGELPLIIDHINHITDDNRIINLRNCNNQQNCMSRLNRSDNRSGSKGVSWHKSSSKWRAYIFHNKKQIHLGLFSTSAEASKVYEAKAKELFGEFYINNNLITKIKGMK
jgi:hypothetical protein